MRKYPATILSLSLKPTQIPSHGVMQKAAAYLVIPEKSVLIKRRLWRSEF
jgi:hypothetical protein